ncbi:transglycosylase family protein [Streptomyces sp. NPDC047987]|uniref:transglycosylase family protein n=1 Tax=unclassified Streptomyces TaxID=2593676 RepID=UPI003417D00E
MGSANGRHRRPRQAPAIIVAAGVTGSAIAIPLLGAGAAQAADSATWDRVAECESGGSWSADFGNGSYGGLQLTPEIWKAYGGEAYAPRADLASRAQQIAVAQKILSDRGPQAWPSCAPISGLTTGGGLPGVDPGSTSSEQSASSAGPERGAQAPGGAGVESGAKSTDGASKSPSGGDATPSGGTGEPSAEGGGRATPSPTGSAASPSDTRHSSESVEIGDSDTSVAPSEASGTPATPEVPGTSGDSGASGGAGGKHRGVPAAEEGRGADRESGRHASRGEGGGRDAASPAAGSAYTVRPGDNLWAIADAQNVPGGWPALYEANKEVVGSDPDLILPGQSLEVGVESD